MPITRAASYAARLAAGEASWPNLLRVIHPCAGRADGRAIVGGSDA
jgi:hypothetical protein